MNSKVQVALEQLLSARGMAAGERRMEQLAAVVQSNLADAIALYWLHPKGTTQLLWSMQGVTDASLVPVLQDALKSKDKNVRWSAIEVLKHFSSPDLLGTFRAAAKDRARDVKEVATEWLEKHGA